MELEEAEESTRQAGGARRRMAELEPVPGLRNGAAALYEPFRDPEAKNRF